MPDGEVLVFIGSIIHCSEPYSLATLEKGFLIVKGSRIIAVDELSNLEACKSKLNLDNYEEIVLSDTQLLIPGFVDTHIHAPQYPNAGLGYDMPLLEWLNKYTYPMERKYSDLQFSKLVYDALVQKTLSYGTTTACYFASLFAESSLVLADTVENYGQRAFVGKISMTRLAPDDYLEPSGDTADNAEAFIKEILSRKNDLVQPIVTPRFALSLNQEEMRMLGELAAQYDCNVQTHISENCDEVKIVQATYEEEYAQVYDDAKLLTKKTVLAHGVYLTDSELKLIASRGSSISHCPTSNTRLKSGLCDVKRLVKNGITVGLGTDVAGGHSPSIIETMRAAVDTSIHLSHNFIDYAPITCYDAFYFATLGGAKALALDSKTGNFAVGKDFDGLIIDMDVANSSANLLEKYDALELLQKFIYLGDDRNVRGVYVAGRKVK